MRKFTPFFYLPKWARFWAFDRFGVFVVFENKPYTRLYGCWLSKGRKKDLFSMCSQNYPGWQKSLFNMEKGKNENV